MFDKAIIDTERFYALPIESQLLYFHLGLHADVKGFVEPRKIARLVGLKVEPIQSLITSGFVIPFETGVVVIKDWNVHNQIREDREAPSRFVTEAQLLALTDNGIYQLQDNSGSTPAQYSIVESSIEENSIEVEKKKLLKGKEQSSYARYVDFFNELTGRKFKSFDKKAQRQYLYLTKCGYTQEDFKIVILNAYADKYHKETAYKYLTPEFLTRTDKFEKFLAVGQPPQIKNEMTDEEKTVQFDQLFNSLKQTLNAKHQ